MNLLYNYFTGTGSAGDLAWSIGKKIVEFITKKYDKYVDFYGIYYNLLYKLRAIAAAFDGNFSWWDLGGAFLDLAEYIIQFLPAGNVVDILKLLWEVANQA